MVIDRPVIPFRAPRLGTRRPTPPPGAGYAAWFRSTLPAGWSVPDHIARINERLAAVERGEVDRLAIHMPPRHGKTESVTVRFAARWIERNPGDNVLITGYNERFARRLSRKVRTLVRERGRVGLAPDKEASDEWETVAGGGVMARGVGSPPTGVGFSLILIDDPVRRREDADSPAYRAKVDDWYRDDLYMRLEPGGVVVLVMTRWHEADLGQTVHDTEPGAWEVLRLPALSANATGETVALWPARYDVDALARIQRVMTTTEGARSWEALFQQNPTPREGTVFKVTALRYCDAAEVPALVSVCRGWDLAATDGGGDYTVGAKLGRDESGTTYVLDVVRGQWGAGKRNAEMARAASADGNAVCVRLPQDPGQAGKEQAQQLTRMLAGSPVTAAPVSGDKVTRADPFASQVEEGHVVIVRAPWNAAFVEELRAFPGGANDDQVDAAADAFNALARPTFDPTLL